jgi:hypothetical protein
VVEETVTLFPACQSSDSQRRILFSIPAMADERAEKKAQPPLVDSILQCGNLAFDPEIPSEMREAKVPAFSSLLERLVKISDFQTIC